mmetsp:Transcript_48157/g.120389  ORF Transcript_48157/g.120389 Transcript_48157/m.120389 type:complete len:209 (+) Transcript_48157:234-860(+)
MDRHSTLKRTPPPPPRSHTLPDDLCTPFGGLGPLSAVQILLSSSKVNLGVANHLPLVNLSAHAHQDLQKIGAEDTEPAACTKPLVVPHCNGHLQLVANLRHTPSPHLRGLKHGPAVLRDQVLLQPQRPQARVLPQGLGQPRCPNVCDGVSREFQRLNLAPRLLKCLCDRSRTLVGDRVGVETERPQGASRGEGAGQGRCAQVAYGIVG